MRQKTLRTFIVDDFEKLKKIVESKYELVKNYYFILDSHNEEIENFLKQKNLNFIIKNTLFVNQKEIVRVVEERIVEKRVNTKIFDKIIRGGVEINSDDNLVFLNRINPGAKIKTLGNVEIFDECMGEVVCDGKYLIVKKNSGSITFRGENIGKVDKLTIFTKDYKKELE
jgi:septum site-determining protein MinC